MVAGTLALLAASPVLLGCGQGGEVAAAREREWAAMVETQQALAAERRELSTLRAQLAAAPVTAEDLPLGAENEALAVRVEALAREVQTRSAALEARLVHFVGDEASAGADGDVRSPEIQAAIRLKSDEDIAIAEEWLARGGDYRRAIEICETQQQLDPGYPRLDEALARARTMRFVTAKRAALVVPGMTPVEVRAALGPVNLRQVLRRPAERLLAWYYPTADGGRVGVFFRYDAQRRAFVVYQTAAGADAAGSTPAPAVTTG